MDIIIANDLQKIVQSNKLDDIFESLWLGSSAKALSLEKQSILRHINSSDFTLIKGEQLTLMQLLSSKY